MLDLTPFQAYCNQWDTSGHPTTTGAASSVGGVPQPAVYMGVTPQPAVHMGVTPQPAFYFGVTPQPALYMGVGGVAEGQGGCPGR